MPNWIIDLYLLVTARVPAPRSLMILASTALVVHLLMQPWSEELAEMGLFAPVLAYLAGHFAAFWTNLPDTVRSMNGRRGRSVLALWLSFATAIMMAPSLAWAQHTITLAFILQLMAFIVLYRLGGTDHQPGWFARDWHVGRRNAANWYITRGVGIILLNEALIRQGSPTDWIVGLSLGLIAMHYLMHWTILATHPFEDEPLR